MTTLVIKIAAALDEASVIDVLLHAFAADPVARWVWPISQQYLCIVLALSGLLVPKRLSTEAHIILKVTRLLKKPIAIV